VLTCVLIEKLAELNAIQEVTDQITLLIMEDVGIIIAKWLVIRIKIAQFDKLDKEIILIAQIMILIRKLETMRTRIIMIA